MKIHNFCCACDVFCSTVDVGLGIFKEMIGTYNLLELDFLICVSEKEYTKAQIRLWHVEREEGRMFLYSPRLRIDKELPDDGSWYIINSNQTVKVVFPEY